MTDTTTNYDQCDSYRRISMVKYMKWRITDNEQTSQKKEFSGRNFLESTY